jgi:hypothetical protein
MFINLKKSTMAIHKGTELNNVNETWNRNEQMRERGDDAGAGNPATGTTTISNDLEQTIHKEAAEYDDANKEDRLLDGERATVKDGSGE